MDNKAISPVRPPSTDEKGKKKPYSRPELLKQGTIEELTQFELPNLSLPIN